MSNPKNVIVVGMPRSGTSLVAGIFARKGYFVADDSERELRDEDEHNPMGYWEAESLVGRNAEVLAAAGFGFDNTWLFDRITPEAVARIGDLGPLPGHVDFLRSYEAHSPWIWKDPRLCYTLPYWWKLVDPESTRVLLTSRDPEAIYRSFIRLKWRNESDEARADVLARIEDHLEAAKDALEALAIPHLVVPYEDFAQDLEGVAARLSDFLGLSLAPEDLQFEPKYDHSGVRGRVSAGLDRLAERMPAPLRRGLKALIPRRILAMIFPEKVS